MSGPTNFLEANALLAIQADDIEAMDDALNELLPGELRELARACLRLYAQCLLYASSKERRAAAGAHRA